MYDVYVYKYAYSYKENKHTLDYVSIYAVTTVLEKMTRRKTGEFHDFCNTGPVEKKFTVAYMVSFYIYNNYFVL
jgi:hypothetical protein